MQIEKSFLEAGEREKRYRHLHNESSLIMLSDSTSTTSSSFVIQIECNLPTTSTNQPVYVHRFVFVINSTPLKIFH